MKTNEKNAFEKFQHFTERKLQISTLHLFAGRPLQQRLHHLHLRHRGVHGDDRHYPQHRHLCRKPAKAEKSCATTIGSSKKVTELLSQDELSTGEWREKLGRDKSVSTSKIEYALKHSMATLRQDALSYV